jgi:uncharacterized membrane protein YedE/YeeE
MLQTLSVIVVSFLVGFAMKRGGLCAYAAAVQIVQDKKIERMMVFLGAAAWATLIVLPLYWSTSHEATTLRLSLSLTHNQVLTTVIGGAVLGIGAFLNKGCFFGAFVQLVSGNLNYLATLAGLSAGVIFTHTYLNQLIPSTQKITDVAQPNPTAFLWLVGMSIFALFMLFSVKLHSKGFVQKIAGLCTLNWQSSFAMVVIGIGGGLLYSTVNGWNYADVLTDATTKLIDDQAIAPSTTAIISTLSMIVGGVIAAITAKEFAIKPAQSLIIVACFTGGLLMGLASLLIPGGNDSLLLKGIPSLAPHALIGFAAMVTMMLFLVYLFHSVEVGYKRKRLN